MKNSFLLLLGPTGVGKTDLAVELARRLNAEIISADARAIYRGMDIGTAKPSPAVRRAVPHHLIDIKEPEEAYNFIAFRRDARAALQQILSRGRLPIVVGGSTLYIQSLTQPWPPLPPSDPDLRHRLRQLATPDLHGRLRQVDPESAQKIHERDRHRLVRALEVHQLTGRPLSRWQQDPPEELGQRALKIGLMMDRKRLYERIDRRTDRMLESDLVEEARRLHARLRPCHQAYHTLCYKELFAHFEGQLSYTQAVLLMKRNSRRYAKRQLTWFRRDSDIVWLDAGLAERDLVQQMVDLYKTLSATETTA